MHLKNTQKKNRKPSKKEKAQTVDNSTDVHYEWLESPPDLEPGTQPYGDAHAILPVIDY